MEVEPKDVFELPVKDRGRVTIPAEKRRDLGVEEGDTVELVFLGSQSGEYTLDEDENFGQTGSYRDQHIWKDGEDVSLCGGVELPIQWGLSDMDSFPRESICDECLEKAES